MLKTWFKPGAREGTTEPLLSRRRIGTILFAAGCAAVLLTILPRLPQDRQVELRLADRQDVTAVDLTWSSTGGEALQGSSFRFDEGRAPSSWTVEIRLPEGDYTLDTSVRRAGRSTSARQSVLVKGEEPILVSLP
jgi:hypothetical protein